MTLVNVPHPKYHWLCHPHVCANASCALNLSQGKQLGKRLKFFSSKRCVALEFMIVMHQMATSKLYALSLTPLWIPRHLVRVRESQFEMRFYRFARCSSQRRNLCRCEIPHLAYPPHLKDPHCQTTAKICDCPFWTQHLTWAPKVMTKSYRTTTLLLVFQMSSVTFWLLTYAKNLCI